MCLFDGILLHPFLEERGILEYFVVQNNCHQDSLPYVQTSPAVAVKMVRNNRDCCLLADNQRFSDLDPSDIEYKLDLHKKDKASYNVDF